GAMDCTAAHCDGYSPRCSCTNRTARSRTSGENLLFLLMAPFSQRLEPPQNSVRFKASHQTCRFESTLASALGCTRLACTQTVIKYAVQRLQTRTESADHCRQTGQPDGVGALPY